MDEKISLEAIAVYSDSYAEKLVKGFFVRKDKISGSEILSFCNIPQINLFIIKELFRTWKEETKKIRSPYFDYDSEEVKEAFENFMNVLSRNILISQQYFTPLVKKAASQALLVIFDPYDYFSMVVTGKNNKLEVAAFREEIRYLKVNKGPLERMLLKLEEENRTEIAGNEAFSILDQILEEVNFTPEDVEEYIEKFSVVAPLNPNSFFIPRKTEPKVEMPLPPLMKKEEEEREVIKTNAGNFTITPVAPPEKPVERISQPKANPAPPTVQERTAKEGRATLADNFQKIRKIKESLTINQKFMFTKVLFHGDFELFSRAIDRLDQFDNISSALRYIEDEHASTWDRDSEEFHEFMELVEKRFS